MQYRVIIFLEKPTPVAKPKLPMSRLLRELEFRRSHEVAVGSGGHPGGVGMEIDERRAATELFHENVLPALLRCRLGVVGSGIARLQADADVGSLDAGPS